ncbi:Uncharacterised protein [Vibrio cholerae]|nr:Uncharacterised protein [Vibrio cholerae]CSI46938.1 Uncharacterised protein [Vibrio cholerae]CSI57089.1 Uncharacterised protein [Vibrio cholerae]
MMTFPFSPWRQALVLINAIGHWRGKYNQL